MSAKKKVKKVKEEKIMENVNEVINNVEEIVTPETVEEVVETTEEVTVESNENVEGVEEVIETPEEVKEEVTEDTNDVVTEDIQEDTEPEVNEVGVVTGHIHGFSKLYVRTEPNKDSEPAGIVDTDTELLIDEVNSTDEFYAVSTATGLKGYCVKTNVKID